ncbi:MAG: NTP transferase domain-containing protein, partial [Candidatus Aminicenantes bacterium]
MRRFEEPTSERAAIILAGGLSERFGRYKGLVSLSGRPLILHVLERISEIVNEIVVVVSSENQKDALESIVTIRARIV